MNQFIYFVVIDFYKSQLQIFEISLLKIKGLQWLGLGLEIGLGLACARCFTKVRIYAALFWHYFGIVAATTTNHTPVSNHAVDLQ